MGENIKCGMAIWDFGRMELQQGIGLRGKCRRTVIDLERRVSVLDGFYHGTLADMPIRNQQIEITWAEGGALCIIASNTASGRVQISKWSQPRLEWGPTGCPPSHVVEAVSAAIG